MQSILIDAESRGLLRSQAFFENVCEELIRTGDLSNNYTFAEYSKTGMEAYGYDYDEERKVLSILIHQYFQEDNIQTVTKSIITTKFNRLKTFFRKCVSGLYKNIEETTEAYSMAYNIYMYFHQKKINKIRNIILTDGKITRTLKEIPSEEIQGIHQEFRIVDIDYIYKIFLSEYSSQEFKINVNLPCLEIPSQSNDYRAFLAVIDGQSLVNIYDLYGQKLFEQNIRTFLQFKGTVNKGIKNTIEYRPDMFFAYNNGISATASEIERGPDGNIIRIIDFQIVNGGQTTSAIYAANKVSHLDVSNINVQMKLSVVKNKEKQSEFVSKVSEYANTQNKVNKSDFFSNSPFHKDMKDYSKKVWAPAINGSQRRTRWFYERVKGEYLNEQAYLTKAGKMQYQLENPKHQLLDKTFLSKSENVWLQYPYIVSKGAQYSFSHFAEQVTANLEENELCITESYFKDSVARVILFRETEKIISKASWYDGGFRAQTVAYTISYLSYLVANKGKYLNFNIIWDNQQLPSSLIDVIKIISEEVYYRITTPPKGNANVGQWVKQKACWEDIKSLDLCINLNDVILIDTEEEKYNKKESQKDKKIESGIKTQVTVVQLGKTTWDKLYNYFLNNARNYSITGTQLDILSKMAKGTILVPTEKQSKVLYDLYKKAITDGVEIAQ